MGTELITAQEARSLLDYDPITGILRFRVSRGSRKAGDVTAQCLDTHGYPHLKLNKRIYLAHRLIWLIYYGEWPSSPIDHINRDPTDNRIDNLRLSDSFRNCHNRKLRPRDLPPGVYRDRGLFRTQFRYMGVLYVQHGFKCPDKAHEAFKKHVEAICGRYPATFVA